MKEPRPMPDAVILSVVQSYAQRCRCCHRFECKRTSYEKAYEILRAMWWAGDHYAFMLGTMYVGVELDGYMHT